MYSGTITGGSTKGKGGNVYIADGSVFNLYAGEITGGTAKTGGNIYCAGTFNMTDGKISGGYSNISSGWGGNIYVGAKGVITVTGGLIENGLTEKTMGGNIMNEGTVNISGTAVISGGSTKGGNSGGNIANSGTVTITGGTIKGGYASEGGNLYNTSTAKTMTFKNCTVTGGVATGLGGGIRYKNGALVLGGDVIIKDNTDKNGTSNICIGNSKQITVDTEGMGANASVGVNLGDKTSTGTIGAIASADGFAADSSSLQVSCDGTNLKLVNKTLNAGLFHVLSSLLSWLF